MLKSSPLDFKLGGKRFAGTAGILRVKHRTTPKRRPDGERPRLESIKNFFESIRSISFSLAVICGGIALAMAVRRELFSDDVLIDVTQVSKKVAENGLSTSVLATEIAARARKIQTTARSVSDSPALELAYLLQSQNHIKALPTLPFSSQNLLIDQIEPIPDLVTSAAEPKIRSAINYVKHSFGRRDNRLSVAIISNDALKRIEARVFLRRDDQEFVESISSDSADTLISEVSRWLAKELFPEASIITQFDLDMRQKDGKFLRTNAALDELAHRNGTKFEPFIKTIRGDIAYYRESFSEARAIYEDVLNHEPSFRQLVVYRLSQTLLRDLQPTMAIELLSRELRRDPENIELATYFAMLYAPNGGAIECASGSKCFRSNQIVAMLERADQSAIAANAVGVLRFQKGDIKGSEERFKKARTLDPNYASAANNLGVLKLEQGDVGEALLLFNRAAALERNSGVVELNIGGALENIGRAADAARHFQNAVSLARESLVCHTCLANSLIGAGQLRDAKQAIDDGIRATPSSATLLVVDAELKIKFNCYREASDLLEAAAGRADPVANRGLIYRMLGENYLRMGMTAKARQAYIHSYTSTHLSSNIADEIDALAASLYVGGAVEFDDDGDDGESMLVGLLERAEGAKKDRTSVAYALGRLSRALIFDLQNGHALRAATLAVQMHPTDDELHKVLGHAYEAQQKGALARSEYRAAFLLGGTRDAELRSLWVGSLRRAGLYEASKATANLFNLDAGNCREEIKSTRASIRPNIRQVRRG